MKTKRTLSTVQFFRLETLNGKSSFERIVVPYLILDQCGSIQCCALRTALRTALQFSDLAVNPNIVSINEPLYTLFGRSRSTTRLLRHIPQGKSYTLIPLL